MARSYRHINGTGGSATLPGAPGNGGTKVLAWSATLVGRLSPTTEIGDVWAYGDITGLSFHGSVICKAVTNATSPLPAVFQEFPGNHLSSSSSDLKGTITLQLRSGVTIGGPVNYTSIDISRNDDSNTLNISFSSDGPWTTNTWSNT